MLTVIQLLAEVDHDLAAARQEYTGALASPPNVLGACAAMQRIADLEATLRVVRQRLAGAGEAPAGYEAKLLPEEVAHGGA